MRKVSIALCTALVLFLDLPPGGLFIPTAAMAQSRDALVLKCRKAVFRKYGWRRTSSDGRRVRTLPKNFVVNQVDHCVANGGRPI